MAGKGNLHSRLVAWMKIILPLIALALLSTLFLISGSFDPTREPVADIDLEKRAQEQGATRPRFTGMTNGGDQIVFMAESARPDPRDPDRLVADDVRSNIKLHQGNEITINADGADMHQREFTATVAGDVRMVTADGYRINTDRLDFRFDTLFAETPGPVTGVGPPGQIDAGRMRLSRPEGDAGAVLVFTNGVKLIYTPQMPEE